MHSIGTMSMLAAAACLVIHASPASADEPEFEHQEASEVEEVEGVAWSASAQGGLVNTTGNSQTTSVSASARASRQAGLNRLRLDANVTYARAAVRVGDDQSGTGVIDDDSEIVRETQVLSQAWGTQARYDRFVSLRDSLYAAGLAGADRPAGTAFAGGGQLGYSRALLRDDEHELIGEAGYDFSYERFASSGTGAAIHSARAFLGYTGTLSETTEAEISGEALSNLNPITKPTRDVGVLGDTRLRGRLAITSQLFEKISFRGSFSARYQSAPGPLPPLDIPFAEGFVPEAKPLDTTTEIALILTFL